MAHVILTLMNERVESSPAVMIRGQNLILHYPLGEHHGGYGFRRSGVVIAGAITPETTLQVPPGEAAVSNIEPEVLRIVDQHKDMLQRAATLFEALKTKKQNVRID